MCLSNSLNTTSSPGKSGYRTCGFIIHFRGPPKPSSPVWLEHDQSKALRALLERDGVPVAEQIRRGVDLWLEKKK
jgi:hypothetical protein